MFSYYGSKSKVVKFYPQPIYPTIIEPFAGSARYALRYSAANVILNDKYDVIYKVWKYLIEANPEQIANLPVMQKGDSLDNYISLSESERLLMGFLINYSNTGKRKTYTGRAARDGELERAKRRILGYLDKIKHWQILNKDYSELENIEATYFIDPPYKDGGHQYAKHKIDYIHLADWCRSRKGQVIVCESNFANWLPFKPLCIQNGGTRKSLEMIWTNSL